MMPANIRANNGCLALAIAGGCGRHAQDGPFLNLFGCAWLGLTTLCSGNLASTQVHTILKLPNEN